MKLTEVADDQKVRLALWNIADELKDRFADMETEAWQPEFELGQHRSYKDIAGRRFKMYPVELRLKRKTDGEFVHPDDDEHIKFGVDLITDLLPSFFNDQGIKATRVEGPAMDWSGRDARYWWNVHVL